MAATMAFIDVNNTRAGEFLPISMARYILVIILCGTMNGSVLVVTRHQRELQESMRVLYQILAVSNMVSGFIWYIWSILWYSFGTDGTCKITSIALSFVYQVSLLSVMACLCGITLNLYLLVTRPLRYHLIVTRTRFYCALVSAILVIMVICGIYLPIPDSPFIKLTLEECINNTLNFQAQWTSVVNRVFQIFPIFVTFTFTTLIYIRLLLIVRSLRTLAPVSEAPRPLRVVNDVNNENYHSSLQDRGHDDPPANVHVDVVRVANLNLDRPSKKGLKGFVTIFLQTTIFCIVWAPYVVTFMTPVHSSLLAIIDNISLCSSWVQPMIYLLTNSEARRLCLTSFSRCLNKVTWRKFGA